MARACIAVNRRDDAIAALKNSVKLDNPSDWQLLVELTSQDPNSKPSGAGGAAGTTAVVGGSGGGGSTATASATSAFAAMQLQQSKNNESKS